MKAISPVPVPQLEHNICLLLCPSPTLVGRRGGLEQEENASHCLRATVPLLRPWCLAGWQRGKRWAASVFKELRPVLGVGEPSLAL